MTRRAIYHGITKLVVILLVALMLKQMYSSASVNDLRWILAPTTFLVELISGASFSFETHAGYMSSDRSFLIAGSCAGVNFLIAAFLMLSLRQLGRQNLSWKFMPAALAVAYVATVVANAVRISIALQLQPTPLEIGSLNANQIHRLEGILIYFAFLLLLFLVTETLTERRSRALLCEKVRAASKEHVVSNNRFRVLRQLVFPLLVYYATTLGMPLANAFYRQEFAAAAFLEHSSFVLLAPLLLIFPLALIRQKKSDLRSDTKTLRLSRYNQLN
jgi:exosortase K